MAQSNLGQILAFLIGISALAAATYCIINGQALAGSFIGGAGLTGLVTAFIKGKNIQQKSLKEQQIVQQK